MKLMKVNDKNVLKKFDNWLLLKQNNFYDIQNYY